MANEKVSQNTPFPAFVILSRRIRDAKNKEKWTNPEIRFYGLIFGANEI